MMNYKNLKSTILLAIITFIYSSNLPAQTFAIIGDYGVSNSTNGPDAQKVADLVKFREPDFVVTVGDNNYPDGEASTLCANITSYYYPFIDANYTEDDLANCLYPNYPGIDDPNTRFFPSPGNHDYHVPDAQPYYDYFNGIPRYYDFVRGDVHFFSMNSNSQEPDGIDQNSIQADWLKSKLEASTAKWKIVYFHHTVYTSGSHNGAPGEAERRWDFKEWGATAVVTGHDHHYERLNVDCLSYFVNGLGGATKRNVGPPIDGSQFIYNDTHGAMFVTADANLIKFEFYAVSEDNPEGVLIDSYTIDDLYPYTDCGENPIPENCCPEGSEWDGANCYFDINIPEGYEPFIWNNTFYTHFGPNGEGDCPSGFQVGETHCRYGSFPSLYDGFIWNNHFYTHENCEADPQLCCPYGSTWDGANCYYNLSVPDGYEPFISVDNGFYVSPDIDGNCPPGSTLDANGCYLGTSIPEGLTGFIYNGKFYANENCDVDNCCPEGTVWNGENCVIELEWEDAIILEDNSIVLDHDPDKGCPENTTLDESGEYCLTGLSVPSGFERNTNGNTIELIPNCNSCCPDGFEFNGNECVKEISLDGADIDFANDKITIRPDCNLFSLSNDCCPEGFYKSDGDCLLRESTDELTVQFMLSYVSITTTASNCLEDEYRRTLRESESGTKEQEVLNGKQNDPSLNLLPNPTSGKVFFDYDSQTYQLNKVLIYNTSGILLHNLSQSQIASFEIAKFNDLKAGTYIVVFEFEEAIVSKKIIKL